ncbi:hypothetical protein HJC23_003599 [Cyclotella cryptica]|uniref:Uncharacterized protein n=1 Tax=Cyclotella cryptica TaxID=29204 RepID=A0ABD3QIK2_9STRA|eukprot:CCRYP_004876-RA/>CCRYP_004876-RA protein AED:0.17 eAED:-0.27 QI:0/-1/0/1/-1/1/1/0/915
MTVQHQVHHQHHVSTSPSFPRTHPRLAGHRSPLDEIEIMSMSRRSPQNAKAAATQVRYEDPPLDMQLLTSLNASFGLIGGDDDDDGEFGCNRDELDRQFELIYEMDDQDDHPDDDQPQTRQHWQQKQHIHRTSHIPYKEQPVVHMQSPLHRHEKQRQLLQTFQHDDADDNTQLSSVDLNPYSARIHRGVGHGTVHNHDSASPKEQHIDNRQSIFRSSPSPSSQNIPSGGEPNSPTNKREALFNLPSPNTVMNRRVNKSSPVTINTTPTLNSPTSPRSQVSPTHSDYNNNNSSSSTTPRPVGILRNPTAISSFTQTTVTSPTTLSSSSLRSRSTSRRRHGTRSQSRNNGESRSIGRSASRSKSRTRHCSGSRSDIGYDKRENMEYHESLFRGAQLIKEQLLRSMADVDREREEEDVLFRNQMDAMVAKARGRHADCDNSGGVGAAAARDRSCEKPKMMQLEDEDLASVDFDYSGGAVPLEQYLGKTSSRSAATATVGQYQPVVACTSMTHSSTTASSVNQRLESESRRLDNLVKIFAKTSSMSSSTQSLIPSPSSVSNNCNDMKKPVADEKSSSSDKENEDQYSQDEMKGPTKIVSKMDSPKSSCVELNNVTTSNNQAFVTQSFTNDDSVGFGYAKQYFQDTTKNNSAKNAPTEGFVPQSELQLQYQQQQQQESQDPKKQHPAEEALSHARAAGPLWRSLVGNHVRFPYAWDSILPSTSPPIDRPNLKWSKWYYVARHRVRGDRKLNSREYGVRSRRSGGRILLNLVIREMHTMNVCREIAIGCFHPNAKGIRKGDPSAEVEDVREVWMAVRWVIAMNSTEPELGVHHYEEDVECFLDSFLTQKRQVLDYHTMGSPLGHRKTVNNENVRAVFGDQPPLQMVDLHDDEFAEILKANDYKKLSGLPALMLLKLFLFSK